MNNRALMVFTLPLLVLVAASPLGSSRADDRIAISLNQTERAMILHEMQQFLSGIQTLVAALATEDMPLVADTARSLGRAMMHQVPPSLKKKLPVSFREMGFAVHNDFDMLALDAQSLGDSKHALNQLSATLKKCVACHAGYQISTQRDSGPTGNSQ